MIGQETGRVEPSRYAGIFVISFATLAYQVLITRIFSVTLYYHFAFAGVTLAMLGLTIGAGYVYLRPDRLSRERISIEFARNATLFAVTSVAAVLFFLYLPVLIDPKVAGKMLAYSMVIFAAPFSFGGICVSLLLTRLPQAASRLYAADLIGAALGCLGIVLALFLLDPFTNVLLIASLAAAAGWLNARGAPEAKTHGRIAAVAASFLLLATLAHGTLYLSGSGHVGVVWAKWKVQTGTLFERWNTFSRVRVVHSETDEPFGWGFAHKPEQRIDQLWLDIDADAGTPISHFTGDFSKVAFLASDVINSAYQIRKPENVAVIGVGGGRDVLSALYFGAKTVTGIEMNPAIFTVLKKRFADFSGHLAERPGVRLINAEARSYLNQSHDTFDLIQISLIDTWAATAAGGLTLSENRLYTVQAWEEFYSRLSGHGMLSVSRWYNAETHPGELYRLVAIASRALRDVGVPPAELADHIIAINVGPIVTVVTSRAPFSVGDVARLQGLGYTIKLGPGVHDPIMDPIVAGNDTPAYYASLPFNIAPSTDDKPFFFFTVRMGDLFTGRNNSFAHSMDNVAVTTILALVALTLVACVLYVVFPLVRMARRSDVRASELALPLLYFAGIGVGFMFIEISQMQRLMVFLGHPVFGLGVVLFTLLLFGGLGSFSVQAKSLAGFTKPARLAGLVLILLAVGLLTPLSADLAKAASTPVRILLSVALLAPAAFFMGMMFPMGLEACRERQEEFLPYLWGANGVMSVFASAFGMALSIEFGIAATYFAGLAVYVLSAATLVALTRTGTAALRLKPAAP